MINNHMYDLYYLEVKHFINKEKCIEKFIQHLQNVSIRQQTLTLYDALTNNDSLMPVLNTQIRKRPQLIHEDHEIL